MKNNEKGFAAIILFIVLVVAAVAGFVFFIKYNNETKVNRLSDEEYIDHNTDAQEIKELISKINTYQKTREIIKRVKKVNPKINLNKFQYNGVKDITYESRAPIYTAKEDNPRWLFSSDKSKAVSWLIHYGEPDSSLWIYNHDGNKTQKVMDFVGTDTHYWGVVWLSKNEFALFEDSEVDSGGKIKYKFIVSFYNLSTDNITTYSQLLEEKPALIYYKDWDERIQNITKQK